MIKNKIIDDSVETESELVTKKERKKKTVEERTKDRKAVFLMLILVVLASIFFWLKSRISGLDKWEEINLKDGLVDDRVNEKEIDGFFVKYKI